MLTLLKKYKGKSVGIRVIALSGKELCYFYKDEPDSKGITRAMEEIYPQMNAGKFADVTFIS